MQLVGFGKDFHKLQKTKSSIKLGGCIIKSDYKIVAFSDGDIIFHSVADAILGACQEGDIGLAFSDTNKANKNLNSKLILDYAIKKAKQHNLAINNIDITIICDKIMIQPIRQRIINNLKKLLKTKKINLKATRFEQNLNLIECDTIVSLTRRKNGK